MPHSKDPDFLDFRTEFGAPSLDDLLAFPKFVQIETVSGCNAGCIMCSVTDWSRGKAAMSPALFQRLVDEIADHAGWVEQVTLQLGGEPLLDKRLEDRVAALKHAGVKSVAFTTNASLLTEDRARSLLASGVDMIDFSIDGATAGTFDAIRLNLSFPQVRDNVLRFIALRDALRPQVTMRVRFVIQKSNAHEFDDFVRFWRPRLSPRDTVVGRFLNWWADWREDLAEVQSVHLSAAREPPPLNDLPCLSLFSTFNVLSDGRVPLCCLDYNADTPMGDLTRSGIADIWRDRAFARVRRLHLAQGRRAMQVCQDCQIFATGAGFDFPGGALPQAYTVEPAE